MFGMPGATELFIILAIALVIFGGSKLRNLGGDIGGAISEFKKGVSGDKEKEEDGEEKQKEEEVVSAASTSAAPEDKPAEQSN